MRKVSFGLAVGFMLVAACGGEEKPPVTPTPAPTTTATPAPTTTTTAEAPKEEPKKSFAEMAAATMKGYPEALNSGDAKKVASFYTDSAVVKFAGMPDLTGRDAIQSMWEKNFAAFSKSKSNASRVFSKGNIVIVEWVWAATNTGEMMGMKATEKPVGVNGADVMWLDESNGLIKEQHTYMDMGTIMSQLGVSKQKARPVATVPSGMPQMFDSKGTPDEAKNTDAFKAETAALENKKEADFLANIADNAEYDDYTQPQTMKGKADAKKFLKEMNTGFPDAKFNIANTWAFGDFVISEGTMTGTQKGSFFGIPATKKSVTVHNLDIQQFKDGKMVKGWSYGNGAEMAMQLGLMPKPGEGKPGDKGAAAKPGDKPATAAKPGDKPATPATTAKPADKK